MFKTTLFVLCVAALVINGHSKKPSKSKMDKLMELIAMLKEEQSTEPTAAPEPECPTGTVRKCESEDPDHGTKDYAGLEARLNDIETQMDEIIKYLSAEKETDKVLKRKSDKVITQMEGKVQETTRVITDLEQSVDDSIDNFKDMINQVNESAQVTINSEGVIFYSRIGSPCLDNIGDCRDENSECRSGKCQCKPGFSYDKGGKTCVEVCDSYGNTYQYVPHYIIRGYNNLIVENVTEFQECKTACEEAADFTCKTIDFFPRWRQCFLSESTFNDVPEEAAEYSGAGGHYQRDCK